MAGVVAAVLGFGFEPHPAANVATQHSPAVASLDSQARSIMLGAPLPRPSDPSESLGVLDVLARGPASYHSPDK